MLAGVSGCTFNPGRVDASAPDIMCCAARIRIYQDKSDQNPEFNCILKGVWSQEDQGKPKEDP
jgi:hypothetical protein